jgi:hypothetical protein
MLKMIKILFYFSGVSKVRIERWYFNTGLLVSEVGNLEFNFLDIKNKLWVFSCIEYSCGRDGN